MNKSKILHQVLDPSGSGGVSAEYRALSQSLLTDKYEFIPMILTDFHGGLSFSDIRFYYRRIKETSPDIIHIRGAAIDGLNAVIAAKLAHKGRILVSVHGMYSDLVYISSVKRFISKHIIEKLIYSLADGISCVCRAAQDRPYFDRWRKKKLPFVYNRMPRFDLSLAAENRKAVREEFDIPEDAVIGLYVGRITREKGLDVLADALRSYADRLPRGFVMMIVGEGDHLCRLKEAAEDIPVRFVFTGDRRDAERFYEAADLFIQPSLHENHSIALLEACAAELPAVAADCGGNAEIVAHGVTGIVVPVADVTELGESIVKMCDADTRAGFRENIRREPYTRFSDEAVDKALDTVYTLLRGEQVE